MDFILASLSDQHTDDQKPVLLFLGAGLIAQKVAASCIAAILC